jgi:hypothetical protein
MRRLRRRRASGCVAKQPPTGSGWAHELKHDGYRLQIHVGDGQVRLFTRNGADWSKRYPRIIEEAARIKGSAIMDAEVVCLIKRGIADFDTLHGRTADHLAVACAFDLLMHDGDDLRRRVEPHASIANMDLEPGSHRASARAPSCLGRRSADTDERCATQEHSCTLIGHFD